MPDISSILILILIGLPIAGYIIYRLAPSSMWSSVRGERGGKKNEFDSFAAAGMLLRAG